jgi:hypothetical protein
VENYSAVMQANIDIHTWQRSKKYTVIPIGHDNWASSLVCKQKKGNQITASHHVTHWQAIQLLVVTRSGRIDTCSRRATAFVVEAIFSQG